MLYGMNDYGEKKEKLNIKKVIIFIAIAFACFIVIFSSSLISYKVINKDNESKALAVTDGNKSDENKASENSNIKKEESVNQAVNNDNQFKIQKHDVEKIKAKFVPNPNDNAKEDIKNIYFSTEKQVFLTFDDGPSKTVTPQILDILKQENVPATFFVLGYRVELLPELVKRAFEEGHYIANHGYSHKYDAIYETPESTWNEYVQCEQSIKNALQNQDYNSYLFRFPGGSSGGKYENVKRSARDIFEQNKIAYTNWNALTGDAAGAVTKEAQLQSMIESIEGDDSVILLMHDAGDKQVTVETLPEIIKYFRDQGYVFKNFYEVF